MHNWSLKKELIELTNKNTIEESLHRLKILKQDEERYTLDQSDGWKRGGSETYLYKFSVKTKNGTRDYLIKACVAYSPTKSIIESWIQRRLLLKNNGICTPILIKYGKGIIIEEYINHGLKEILQSNPNLKRTMLKKLAIYSGTLTGFGFAPIDAFGDLRTRGDDVVVIDFGEDIGPPYSKEKMNDLLFQKLIEKLSLWSIHVEEELKKILYEMFNDTVNKISVQRSSNKKV